MSDYSRLLCTEESLSSPETQAEWSRLLCTETGPGGVRRSVRARGEAFAVGAFAFAVGCVRWRLEGRRSIGLV